MFQCLDPLVAVSQFRKEDGKHFLKLYSKKRLDYDLMTLKAKYGSDNVFVLPCGTCESCRRNKAEDWAVRCELEAKEHKHNYFLTLTFNDSYYKYASQADLRAFLDHLEGFAHERKFKYFAAQEFGETTHRLHFHLVLFCDFDLKIHDPVKIGDFYQYKSDLISSIWKCGFYTLSPFETTCARYVAKYTAKDSKLFMSRNLGKSYFMHHYQEIIDDGFKVYSNFGGKFHHYVPNCFLRWYEEIDPEIVKDHKQFKKSIAHLVLAEKRRKIKQEHEEAVISSDQKRIKEKVSKKRRL